MQIHQGIAAFPPGIRAIVTSGTFDGVHLGHRKIISRVNELARQHQGQGVLLTYWPHPRMVLDPNSSDLKLLSTLDEKAELLAACGVDHLVVLPFNRDFSLQSSHDFIERILVSGLHTHTLVMGYDHRFGRNREGGFEYLTENAPQYGFAVEEIPRQDIDHLAISSSKIRQALLSGEVLTATALLGRPYELTGTVVKGRQLGRQLGYPTANLEIPEAFKLIPSDGIYAVQVRWHNYWYGGMLSIGTNPTVDGTHRTVEVNLFDFDSEIYGEKLTLRFIGWLRPHIKFDSVPALVTQIGADKQDSLKILHKTR